MQRALHKAIAPGPKHTCDQSDNDNVIGNVHSIRPRHVQGGMDGRLLL
jgi:hypothetical protein